MGKSRDNLESSLSSVISVYSGDIDRQIDSDLKVIKRGFKKIEQANFLPSSDPIKNRPKNIKVNVKNFLEKCYKNDNVSISNLLKDYSEKFSDIRDKRNFLICIAIWLEENIKSFYASASVSAFEYLARMGRQQQEQKKNEELRQSIDKMRFTLADMLIDEKASDSSKYAEPKKFFVAVSEQITADDPKARQKSAEFLIKILRYTGQDERHKLIMYTLLPDIDQPTFTVGSHRVNCAKLHDSMKNFFTEPNNADYFQVYQEELENLVIDLQSLEVDKPTVWGGVRVRLNNDTHREVMHFCYSLATARFVSLNFHISCCLKSFNVLSEYTGIAFHPPKIIFGEDNSSKWIWYRKYIKPLVKTIYKINGKISLIKKKLKQLELEKKSAANRKEPEDDINLQIAELIKQKNNLENQLATAKELHILAYNEYESASKEDKYWDRPLWVNVKTVWTIIYSFAYCAAGYMIFFGDPISKGVGLGILAIGTLINAGFALYEWKKLGTPVTFFSIFRVLMYGLVFPLMTAWSCAFGFTSLKSPIEAIWTAGGGLKGLVGNVSNVGSLGYNAVKGAIGGYIAADEMSLWDKIKKAVNNAVSGTKETEMHNMKTLHDKWNGSSNGHISPELRLFEHSSDKLCANNDYTGVNLSPSVCGS